MQTTVISVELVRFDDGRVFPRWGAETLSWSVGLYMTLTEERTGFPRARAVIRAMREHRPSDLARERLDALRGSFGMFAGNARQLLLLIEEEAPEPRS